MNTQLLCFLLLYVIPLLITWIHSIVVNWSELHTIGDFILPLDQEDNFLIWFPFMNLIFCLCVLFWMLQSFLNIKIKK